MARYGSSPAHQLNVLSQTLRQGMVDRGNLDLQKAQLEYQLNDPRNQLARTQAMDKLAEIERDKSTPATVTDILGDEALDAESLEHFGSNILPELEKHGVTVRSPDVHETERLPYYRYYRCHDPSKGKTPATDRPWRSECQEVVGAIRQRPY